MAQNLNAIKGTPRAVGNDVLVTHMHFGEQTTASGLIIKDDNGSTRGIYPRWARVYSIGSTNEDTEFEVGDWILIKHGRWTRALALQTAAGEIEIRKVELESILAMSKDRPDGLQIGAEYSDGQHATVDPSSFINA
jgi:co-chaperonin GroES (HSP10)|tara:strand:- start:287 stop:694 length:408 start_codon:yes stop_codon:yes gene_type:complete